MRLSADDRQAIFAWLTQRIEENKQTLLADLPEGWRNRFASGSEQAQQRTLFWLAVRRLRPGQRNLQMLTVDNVRDLKDRLSPAARAQLDAQPKSQQMRLLREWMMFSTREHAAANRWGRSLQPVIPREELESFYNDKEKLTAAERSEIDETATPQARQHQLAMRYLRYYSLAPRHSGGRWNRGPGTGGRNLQPGMRGSLPERPNRPYERRGPER